MYPTTYPSPGFTATELFHPSCGIAVTFPNPLILPKETNEQPSPLKLYALLICIVPKSLMETLLSLAPTIIFIVMVPLGSGMFLSGLITGPLLSFSASSSLLQDEKISAPNATHNKNKYLLKSFFIIKNKKRVTVCNLFCIWLPPSDLLYNKHETVHAYGMNLSSACSRRVNIGGIRYKRTRAKSSIF